MRLSAFLKARVEAGLPAGNLFESWCQQILSAYLRQQNKGFVPVGGAFEIDGEAPDGFDSQAGPTAVVIKYSKVPRPSTAWLAEFIETTLGFSARYGSMLFVLGGTGSVHYAKALKKFSDKRAAIQVWDEPTVDQMFDRYAPYVRDLPAELQNKQVSNIVERSISQQDWKALRNEHLANLKRAYVDNDLVLVLGAGVSINAGLPSWNLLLSHLLVQLVETKLAGLSLSAAEAGVVADALNRLNEASPLLIARYIRTGLGDQFYPSIYKSLYGSLPAQVASTQLDALADLCIPRRDGKMRMQAVITYNFDDLLEQVLKQRGLECSSIANDADPITAEKLPIYHVHGFMPANNPSSQNNPNNMVVFSEEGYHHLYLDPYSWSNLVQLTHFRDHTALLIGTSVTDPNLRRILEIAAKKRQAPAHYVILRRDTVNMTNSSASVGNMATQVLETAAAVHHELLEQSFRELGLNVVWIEGFDEIPGLLRNLRV